MVLMQNGPPPFENHRAAETSKDIMIYELASQSHRVGCDSCFVSHAPHNLFFFFCLELGFSFKYRFLQLVSFQILEESYRMMFYYIY